MPLSLPQVTLSAVTSINHELTVRAMIKCLEHCSFGDVVLLSSQPIEAPFRVEVVPPFGGEEYATMICRNLASYTPTDFNLTVQYDSHIVEPRAWSDDFLNFDYLGPKWPWHIEGRRVGNSGFCLRSKKLLGILAELQLPPVGQFLDDTYVCHTLREMLEAKFGIRIAPDEVADRFAYERHEPESPTFGVHGLFNFWRHTDDSDMIALVRLLDPYNIQTRAFAEILFRYYDARKYSVFYEGYCRLRDQVGVTQARDHLGQFLRDSGFIDRLVRKGEELTAFYKSR